MTQSRERQRIAAGYDQAAAGYDQRHGDTRSRRRFDIIDRPQLAIAAHARRVLELGCGTGRLLGQLGAGRRGLAGIDISPAMLRQARARGLDVALADAHALPFAEASFDAVLAGKGVFRYLDYERAFAECARVLAPDGRLAVHQYGARTLAPGAWLKRRIRRQPLTVDGKARGAARSHEPAAPAGMHGVGYLSELYQPAGRAGLEAVHTYLWRSVRVPPYAIPVPACLPERLGGLIWSHCVIIFRKP